jgi:hypothetical protein
MTPLIIMNYSSVLTPDAHRLAQAAALAFGARASHGSRQGEEDHWR